MKIKTVTDMYTIVQTPNIMSESVLIYGDRRGFIRYEVVCR